MYGMLDPASRDELDEEEFADAYLEAAGTATVTELEIDGASEEDGGAVLPVSAATEVFGTIAGDVRLQLTGAGEVEWAPHLVFPGPRRGRGAEPQDHGARARASPRRGRHGARRGRRRRAHHRARGRRDGRCRDDRPAQDPRAARLAVRARVPGGRIDRHQRARARLRGGARRHPGRRRSAPASARSRVRAAAGAGGANHDRRGPPGGLRARPSPGSARSWPSPREAVRSARSWGAPPPPRSHPGPPSRS